MSDWAAAEGWNPGGSDMACFSAQDPDGFFVGFEDGVAVSCVSVVTYGASFAFLGLYLARPDRRGRGYGYATWQAALAHAGRRTVGLDGVVAQQANYARSGFSPAHRTIRYGGVPTTAGGTTQSLEAGRMAALRDYDTACFPADRIAFLDAWLTAPGHVVRVVEHDGAVTGYGVARPCRDGMKIGPLFADGPAEADRLFDALVDGIGRTPVFIDVPETNPAAVSLAEARGLAPCFETARMYTGPIRPIATDRIFGITSLELG